MYILLKYKSIKKPIYNIEGKNVQKTGLKSWGARV